MAISTDALIDFFGAQDSADSSSAAITNTSFSVAGDIASWTNDDDAPVGNFVLKCQYPSGTLGATPMVKLYARLKSIDGANHAGEPDAGFPQIYLGAFILDDNLAATTNQYMPVANVRLPNLKSSQIYDFYIENLTGVTISAGWTLKVTPATVGPHA